MTNYLPYTYLIGWSKHNKWYYGVQTGKNCHPRHLWSKYYTSSKIVKLFRKIHGEPDVIKVRRTFKDSKAAFEWEIKVLRRLSVISQDKWLNQRVVYMDGSNSCKDWMKTEAGKNLLREARQATRLKNPEKFVAWNKGKTKQDHIRLQEASDRAKLHQKQGRITCIGDHMRGTSFTDTHRTNLSRAATQREPLLWVTHPASEQNTRIRECDLDQYLSQGWKRGRCNFVRKNKGSIPTHIQTTVSTCIHCGKSGKGPAMLRWHHDNCKSRLTP